MFSKLQFLLEYQDSKLKRVKIFLTKHDLIFQQPQSIIATMPVLFEISLLLSSLKQLYCDEERHTVHNCDKCNAILAFVSGITSGVTFIVAALDSWKHPPKEQATMC